MGDRRSRGKILVALFLLVWLGSPSLRADERKEMILLNDIDAIIRLYLAANTTPIEFLNLIADDIDKTYEKSGSLTFQPKVAALQKSYLRFRVKPTAIRSEYLELRIRPDADLRLKDLQARWGMSQTLIPGPSARFAEVIFPIFKEAGLPYAGRIIASVEWAHDDSERGVVELEIDRVPLTKTTEDLFEPTIEATKKKRSKKLEK